MSILTDPDALPQLIGDYLPADQWQCHINKLFYALRGNQLRDFYQTFASADHRLAHALAAQYYEQVQRRDQASGVRPGASPVEGRDTSGDQKSSPQALVVHEWGCGNGTLAACFLSHLQVLDKAGGVYPRVRYVLVDNHPESLDVARKHPDLIAHEERVETLCADVTKLSGVPDGTVDRIICNELWNDLPTKLVLRKEAEHEEEFIRPNLTESRCAAIKDWSRFVGAFDSADIDALREFHPFFEDIIWEKEYRKVEWKDVPFRKTITEFIKRLDEQVLVPVNVGAALTIKEAKRVMRPDAIGLSSFDAGTASLNVLNDPDKPCYGQYGGQFSFVVNFALLEAVADYCGIRTIDLEPQKEFVSRSLGTKVASLMDLLATHPSVGRMQPWEQDRLIVETIRALNDVYHSPYKTKMGFPLNPEMPREERERLQGMIQSMREDGVPDTVAYLTEEEVLAAQPGLEGLGYEREAISAALAVPPQGVDYTHMFLKSA